MEYFIENPANGIMEEVTDPAKKDVAFQYMVVSLILGVSVFLFVLTAIFKQVTQLNKIGIVLFLAVLFLWVIKFPHGEGENQYSASVIQNYFLKKLKDNE